jgi:hypothetical protein
MATEKYIAGTVGLTWSAYTSAATFDSIVSGNAIISDLQLDNSANLDVFCDVSVALGSAAIVAPELSRDLPVPAERRWHDLRRRTILVFGGWPACLVLLGR